MNERCAVCGSDRMFEVGLDANGVTLHWCHRCGGLQSVGRPWVSQLTRSVVSPDVAPEEAADLIAESLEEATKVT